MGIGRERTEKKVGTGRGREEKMGRIRCPRNRKGMRQWEGGGRQGGEN